MKNAQDVLKFNFQEIELSEIRRLLPNRNRSKYAELRQQIVDRVNSLAGNKSFIFAPAGDGKVTPKIITNLCHGVNVGFAKEKMNWRVVYSTVAKAFVVEPYKRKNGISKTVPKIVAPQEGFQETPGHRLEQLVNTVKKVFNVTVQEMSVRNAEPDIMETKRAFLYVGRNLGIRLSTMGELLHITSSSRTVFCQQALTRPAAKEKVEILIKAINGGK